MWFGGENGQASFECLRIKSNGLDPLTVRLRATHALDALEIRPEILGPSSVLFVRKLLDPLPGTLNLDCHLPRSNFAWERAINTTLEKLAHDAVRPINNAVPADAEAVWFADIAEMLACFAIDVIRSEVREHWWWYSLMRNASHGGMELLARLLGERPEELPAVLHHLAERGQAAMVVDGFTNGQASALLASVCRGFGLADLTAELSPAPGFSRVSLSNSAARAEDLAGIDVVGETGQRPKSTLFETPSSFSTQAELNPPWIRWLPPGAVVPGSLPLEKACLLGVGLGLYKAPAAIRSARFLRQFRAWVKDVQSSQQPLPVRAAKIEFQGPERPLPSLEKNTVVAAEEGAWNKLPPQRHNEEKPPYFEPVLRDENQGEIAPGKESERLEAAHVSPVFRSSGDAGEAAGVQIFEAKAEQHGLAEDRVILASDDHVIPASDDRPVFPAGPASPAERGVSREESITPAVRSFEESQDGYREAVTETGPSEESPAATDWALQLEDGVDTRLGGAFYMVNLMAYLDLPDCFEEEWELAGGLGAWGLLNLLCRALLDEVDSPELEADPLWPVLAFLAGHEQEELPGAALVGCAEYRLPMAWPLLGDDDSKPQAFAWAVDEQSLWLWSQQGWLLADARLTGEAPERQVQSLAARYASAFSLNRHSCAEIPLAHFRGALLDGLNPALMRWLVRVMPYLRFRLQRALNWTEEDGGLAEIVLIHPAKVYVSSVHVDVFMSLNDISLPLRMAGLDRNPGWLPEFGRFMLLHFNER